MGLDGQVSAPLVRVRVDDREWEANGRDDSAHVTGASLAEQGRVC